MTSLHYFLSRNIDKIAHMLACVCIVYVVTDFLLHHTPWPLWLDIIIGVVVAILFSIGKELLDKKTYGLFDIYDLAWDGIGILGGIGLIILNFCII